MYTIHSGVAASMICNRGVLATVSARPKRPPWKMTPMMGRAATPIQRAQGMMRPTLARRAALRVWSKRSFSPLVSRETRKG